MAALARFKIGGVFHKARIFERGTNRLPCQVCGETRYGVKVRFKEPQMTPMDKGVCHECLMKIALGAASPQSILGLVDQGMEAFKIEHAKKDALYEEQIAGLEKTISNLKSIKKPRKVANKKKKKVKRKSVKASPSIPPPPPPLSDNLIDGTAGKKNDAQG